MAGPGLAEMNAFVAIVEQRSFAKAAVQLGVSPSGRTRAVDEKCPSHMFCGGTNMRIFLAGATGLIGIRLLPLMFAEGHVIAAMTRTQGKAP